jgi:cytochrome c oxidase assembly protein subunit 15
MRLPRLTPAQYRRITVVALALLAVIIVTGGAVRLTGSGLGCPDWPNCSPGRLTPRGASDVHGMVEFVNRLVTGLVSIVVIVAVLGSLVRRPWRRDLVLLSLGLVVGVVAQIILGALVVDELLSPPWVMGHFLVSMVLLANGVVLVRRAGQPDTRAEPVVTPSVVWLGRVLVLVAAFVVVTGTVVTGAGPHSGDVPGISQRATRLDIAIRDAARVHGSSVMVFLVLVLVVLWVLRHSRAPRLVMRRIGLLLGALVAQAAVGYVQYFTGIPSLLVGFHLAGAATVWAATLWFYLGLFERSHRTDVGSDRARADRARARALATA